MNVGVFGAGRIASSVHIPNILRDRRYNINWVVEENEQQSQKVKDQLFLHDIPFLKFKDRKSLLADKGLLEFLIFFFQMKFFFITGYDILYIWKPFRIFSWHFFSRKFSQINALLFRYNAELSQIKAEVRE